MNWLERGLGVCTPCFYVGIQRLKNNNSRDEQKRYSPNRQQTRLHELGSIVRTYPIPCNAMVEACIAGGLIVLKPGTRLR